MPILCSGYFWSLGFDLTELASRETAWNMLDDKMAMRVYWYQHVQKIASESICPSGSCNLM